MAKIVSVSKKGYGRKLGLRAGDEVISAGGYPFCDELDYLFYDADCRFDLEIVTRKAKKKTVKVNKSEGQSLGLEFEEMTVARCKNKCRFCFVDQLPKGMRDTLYVKDDDYRFSFVSGNYVTLTNLSDDDFKRIVRLKLSPLYVSVHAYDGEVRKALVKNPQTLCLIDRMKELAAAGIQMHTQVVLCEGINDGNVLEETLNGLYAMYPSVKSLAVVPVGLTRHREGLESLNPLSGSCLTQTLDMVEKFNEGREFCWCSDEFYVKAGRPIPPLKSYGDFPQIENGVGLIAKFNDNLDYGLRDISFDCGGKRAVMLTGVSFAPYLERAVKKIEEHFTGLTIKVQPVKNAFFGKDITVAGLITGGDLLEQAERGADMYIIPSNMLRRFEDVFLDGVSLAEVRKKLGRVEVSDGLGENLADILMSLLSL